MGTGNITYNSVSTSDVLKKEHVNDLNDAIEGDFVPRNTSGTVVSLAGGLGTATYKWGDIHATELNITDILTNGDYAKITYDITGTNENVGTITVPTNIFGITYFDLTESGSPSGTPTITLPDCESCKGKILLVTVHTTSIITSVPLDIIRAGTDTIIESGSDTATSVVGASSNGIYTHLLARVDTQLWMHALIAS